MTMIEAVREYLETFPGFAGGLLHVDFLPAGADSYSVDVIPCKEIVKSYMDGSSVRQFLFVLATRTWYGPEVRQQIDNLGFFEAFGQWLEMQSARRNFPLPDKGRRVQKMEVLSSGYVFAPEADTARYQIQCRVLYVQPRVSMKINQEE